MLLRLQQLYQTGSALSTTCCRLSHLLLAKKCPEDISEWPSAGCQWRAHPSIRCVAAGPDQWSCCEPVARRQRPQVTCRQAPGAYHIDKRMIKMIELVETSESIDGAELRPRTARNTETHVGGWFKLKLFLFQMELIVEARNLKKTLGFMRPDTLAEYAKQVHKSLICLESTTLSTLKRKEPTYRPSHAAFLVHA